MNELAVVELQGSEAELLSKIKPSRAHVWDFDNGGYKFVEDLEKQAKIEAGVAEFKDGVKELFAVGRDFKKNVGRFALALRKVYRNVGAIEDFSPEPLTYTVDGDMYIDSFCTDNGFKYITELLGISKSTAYRYKDLSVFVDESSGEFKDEYKDYSISLLSEILALNNWLEPCTTYSNISKFIKMVPSTTTIDEIREYRKVLRLFRCWEPSFDSSGSRDNFFSNSDIYSLTLAETLEKYHDWQQKQAVKDLEDKLSGNSEQLTDLAAVGVSASAAVTESQPVAAREILVGESELQKYKDVIEDKQRQLLELGTEITELKSNIYRMKSKLVENLNECEGCKYNGVKPQKCQCCRRNGKLKDLFEEA